jgi:hypothetical protein
MESTQALTQPSTVKTQFRFSEPRIIPEQEDEEQMRKAARATVTGDRPDSIED